MSSIKNSVAVMQPYVFPYIGYFQLIKTVDYFVFYDDVNFIKQGWVNRNKILNSNDGQLFSVPIKNISSYKQIKDTYCDLSDRWVRKFFTMLAQTYSKSPYYNEVIPLIEQTFRSQPETISELAISSVNIICEYLKIDTTLEISSRLNIETTTDQNPSDRLIKLTNKFMCENYVNFAGGKVLYSKKYFNSKGIKIYFIESQKIDYKQFGDSFIPNLSIIDVLMFNSPSHIESMLSKVDLT